MKIAQTTDSLKSIIPGNYPYVFSHNNNSLNQPVANSSSLDSKTSYANKMQWLDKSYPLVIIATTIVTLAANKFIKGKITPEVNAKIFNFTEKLLGTGLRTPKFSNSTTFQRILDSGHTSVSIPNLTGAAYNALRAKGVPHPAALSTANALVHANSVGVTTHGIRLLPIYLPQIANGKINAYAKPELVRLFQGTAVIDAKEGLAYHAVDKAVDLAGKLAAKHGISFVTVNNSHHCGEMGQFVERLAEERCVAIMGSTNAPTMAAVGSNKAMLGTSPLAFAFPGNGANLVADYALTKGTYNQVLVAAQNEQTIPQGIILNRFGNHTTNPNDFFDEAGNTAGTMVAAGDHKGNLVAQLLELLCGAGGGKFSFQTPSHMMSPFGNAPQASQFIIAIDPKKFQAKGGDIYEHFQRFFDELKHTGGRVAGTGREGKMQEAAEKGITIDFDTLQQLSML